MDSRYSKVQSSIWTSDKFKSLKGRKHDFPRLVYMYLLTCPFGNSAGLFKLEQDYALVNLSCTEDQYRAAIGTLIDVGLIDEEDGVIFIRQFLKFNPYANINHAKGSASTIKEFMGSRLYSLFYNDLLEFCDGIALVKDNYDKLIFPEPKEQKLNGIETVSKPINNGIELPRPIPITNNQEPIPNDSAEQAAPVITLTLNDGSEYPVMQKYADEMAALYPAVDITQEFRKMRAWLINNPKRRKTSQGIKKFINGWLSREQDKGRASPQRTNGNPFFAAAERIRDGAG